MDPLVRASFTLQRMAERYGVGLLALAGGAVLLASKLMPSWGSVGSVGLATGLFMFGALFGLIDVLRRPRDEAARALSGLMASITGFVGIFVAKSSSGSLDGLVYLALAVSSALLGMRGLTFVALVALVSFVVPPAGLVSFVVPPAMTESSADVAEMSWRFALGLVFTFLFRGLFQQRIVHVTAQAKARLHDERQKLQDAARAYRLVGGVESPERGLESGVVELEKSVEYVLSLLVRGLELHAVAYYSADPKGRLTLRSSVAGADLVRCLDPQEGPLAVAVVRRESLELVGQRAASRVAPYVVSEQIGSLYCIPASRGASFEGLLYFDRISERSLDAHDRKLVDEAIDFILRATENERAFARLEKQAREQAKLYRAAEALGAARNEAEVIELGVESARDVASFDFAAVTLFHKKSGLHEICAVSGGQLEHLVGSTFRQNAGLVSMVVANQHPLPYRGEYDSERQVLFARGQEPPGLPSLLVLPLLLHDRALGTLVLGSRQKGVFSEEVRPTLEVLSRHMAVSLANARMVSRLEEQATTDGLTGLLNKRALIRAAERRIKAAARFGKPLSILVTDIDFFKKVNDTYGHDVGDVVIKGLGEVLRRVQRDTDISGRFGGEEFIVVCEQTDEEGALNLAERVRRELEGTTFQTELGPLRVTCSIGVATFPGSGKDWESLFKATDEALYASKRGGRNRVTVWRPRLKASHSKSRKSTGVA
jgi:two-component system, cell cycle response regulator